MAKLMLAVLLTGCTPISDGVPLLSPPWFGGSSEDDLWMLDGDVNAVSGSTTWFWQWDGQGWVVIPFGVVGGTTIAAVEPGVVAVGDSLGVLRVGADRSIEDLGLPPTEGTYQVLARDGTIDVAYGELPELWTWDGAAWSRLPDPPMPGFGLASGPDTVWWFSGTSVALFSGGAWSAPWEAPTQSWWSPVFPQPDRLWALADDATVVRALRCEPGSCALHDDPLSAPWITNGYVDEEVPKSLLDDTSPIAVGMVPWADEAAIVTVSTRRNVHTIATRPFNGTDFAGGGSATSTPASCSYAACTHPEVQALGQLLDGSLVIHTNLDQVIIPGR